ncbi:MAG: acyl-CoA/acyl-ACP dehydrogenase [Acidimicrobiales bacterium]|jgi:alkylation response protein AidB-like acyl-CoA dehydrogenase|nr:acyl-CoA/acyl-ACP dehydrogenase [Acidimicrobiales bacterium]
MDFARSDEQVELTDMIRRFAEDRFPTETVRAFGEPGGFDRGRWAELAALGTFGIALPEAEGGVGLGTIDAVLVHETLGAALTPGPLTAASLLAGLVPGVLEGEVVPALVERPAHGPFVVEHLRDADLLVVVDEDGWRIHPAATVERDEVAHPTDPTTPVSIVRDLPEVAPSGDAGAAARLGRLASLYASAQLVGGSEASTALAVGYAQERHQFGRPIGSFQGLKHLLADCLVRTEVARSSVWAAGVIADEPDAGDLSRAVAGARVLAARAGTENAKTCIQVHGGMGFTWEVDAHLFLKRAWVLETQFDTPDGAADAVAGMLVG